MLKGKVIPRAQVRENVGLASESVRRSTRYANTGVMQPRSRVAIAGPATAPVGAFDSPLQTDGEQQVRGEQPEGILRQQQVSANRTGRKTERERQNRRGQEVIGHRTVRRHGVSEVARWKKKPKALATVSWLGDPSACIRPDGSRRGSFQIVSRRSQLEASSRSTALHEPHPTSTYVPVCGRKVKLEEVD